MKWYNEDDLQLGVGSVVPFLGLICTSVSFHFLYVFSF